MSRPVSTFQAVVLSCLLSVLALALIHVVTYASGETAASDEKFYEVAQRYLDETLRLFPTQASIHGYHKYDGALEDFSDAGVRKMTDTFKRLQKELGGWTGRSSASARRWTGTSWSRTARRTSSR